MRWVKLKDANDDGWYCAPAGVWPLIGKSTVYAEDHRGFCKYEVEPGQIIKRFKRTPANWIYGGLRSDGYYFFMQYWEGIKKPMVLAGCRCFDIEGARDHWNPEWYIGGIKKAEETMKIIGKMEKETKRRGWMKPLRVRRRKARRSK